MTTRKVTVKAEPEVTEQPADVVRHKVQDDPEVIAYRWINQVTGKVSGKTVLLGNERHAGLRAKEFGLTKENHAQLIEEGIASKKFAQIFAVMPKGGLLEKIMVSTRTASAVREW